MKLSIILLIIGLVIIVIIGTCYNNERFANKKLREDSTSSLSKLKISGSGDDEDSNKIYTFEHKILENNDKLKGKLKLKSAEDEGTDVTIIIKDNDAVKREAAAGTFYAYKAKNNEVEDDKIKYRLYSDKFDKEYIFTETDGDTEFEIKSDDVDILPGYVFVGNNSPISENKDKLSTNNTLFIKDGINIGKKNESVYLDMKTLKYLKYLPYNFKEKLCLGSSCINKHPIKVLKGEKPFKVNTYVTPKPFTFFSEKNYSGWANGYETKVYASLLANKGVKSYKISDPNYTFTAFENPNNEGRSVEMTAAESGDVTGLFPNGFKSISPKSSKGNKLNNFCFQNSQVIHKPNDNNEYIQAVPCENSTDVYYILRQDKLVHTEHKNEGCSVDMHDHTGRQGYHHDDTSCD